MSQALNTANQGSHLAGPSARQRTRGSLRKLWLSAACLSSALVVGCGGASAQGPGATSDLSESNSVEGSSDSTASTGAGSKESVATKPQGARPPDFELETLDGGSVRLSDHLGKDVILIDFWATFCDPCIAAMPHLDEIYQRHKSKGFVILGVSIDGPDALGLVRTEVAKLKVTFPILLDKETRVVSLYNPKTSAPYSVLIGRDGRIITKKEGYVTGDAAAIERDIEAALAAGR